MAVPSLAMQEALAWLQRGQLGQAEKKLKAVLQADPGDFAARHLLGIVLLQAGQALRALEQIERAIEINPGVAIAHYNRGNAQSALQQPAAAVASYDRAIALRPEMAEAHFNRGNALRALGQAEPAIASFRQGLALQPGLYQAHNNIGSTLLELRRPREALVSFDAALSIKPDHVESMHNRGMALHRLQRLDEALACFDRVIALRPGLADVFNNRALVLQDLGYPEAAIESYARCLALQPEHADAWSNRASALVKLKRLDEALESCERALALQPGHAGACNVRGIALHEGRRLEEALASYEQALALKPDFAEAWNNRGNALHDQRRLDEALLSFQHAIDLEPEFAEAINNRGMIEQDLRQFDAARRDYDAAIGLKPGYTEALRRRAALKLLHGRLADGWADYEAGLESSRRGFAPEHGIAYWRGEDLAGKSILLSEPNGLGDTLQFFRFVPALLAAGARVSFLGPRSFFRVLDAFSDRVRFLSSIGQERFDFQCWLWSLPHFLRAQATELSASVPYLRAEPALVDHWAALLDRDRFNIGICWQGNPERKIDRARSIPLAAFLPLAQIPGVKLISLQKNFGLEQLQRIPAEMRVESPGPDFDEGADAFVDSAALLENLDLVVAADTSITHLAGALGRPAWLALNYVPDWRWMLDRADSPWYPSVRLFRQQRSDDWGPVFESMATAVREVMAGHGGIPPGRSSGL